MFLRPSYRVLVDWALAPCIVVMTRGERPHGLRFILPRARPKGLGPPDEVEISLPRPEIAGRCVSVISTAGRTGEGLPGNCESFFLV